MTRHPSSIPTLIEDTPPLAKAEAEALARLRAADRQRSHECARILGSYEATAADVGTTATIMRRRAVGRVERDNADR